MITPIYNKLRKDGGTFYTFTPSTKDMALMFSNDSNIKMNFSKFVCLNLPPWSNTTTQSMYIDPQKLESLNDKSSNLNADTFFVKRYLQNYAENLNTILDANRTDDNFSNPSELSFFKSLMNKNDNQSPPLQLRKIKDVVDSNKKIYGVYQELENTVGYQNIIKYVGDMNLSNYVQKDGQEYLEIFAHIPTSSGQIKDIQFIKNDGIKPLSTQIPSNGTDWIVGQENAYKNAPTKDETFAKAVYDTPDKKYVVSSETDMLQIDWDDLDDPKSIVKYNQGNFDFNAVLVYYDIFDANDETTVKRNLYGIFILDSFNTESPTSSYIKPFKKLQPNENQSGNSFGFRFNFMFNSTTNIVTSSYVINDYSTISMELYMEAMEQLKKVSVSYDEVSKMFVSGHNKILELEQIVLTLKKFNGDGNFDEIIEKIDTFVTREDVIEIINETNKNFATKEDINGFLTRNEYNQGQTSKVDTTAFKQHTEDKDAHGIDEKLKGFAYKSDYDEMKLALTNKVDTKEFDNHKEDTDAHGINDKLKDYQTKVDANTQEQAINSKLPTATFNNHADSTNAHGIDDKLKNYATKTEVTTVSTGLSDHKTEVNAHGIDDKLKNYAIKTEVTKGLDDHKTEVNAHGIDDKLKDYAQKGELNTKVENSTFTTHTKDTNAHGINDKLKNYATKTEVTTVSTGLSDHKTEVNAHGIDDKLKDYATKTELTTVTTNINNHKNDTNAHGINDKLKDYVKKSEVADLLNKNDFVGFSVINGQLNIEHKKLTLKYDRVDDDIKIESNTVKRALAFYIGGIVSNGTNITTSNFLNFGITKKINEKDVEVSLRNGLVLETSCDILLDGKKLTYTQGMNLERKTYSSIVLKQYFDLCDISLNSQDVVLPSVDDKGKPIVVGKLYIETTYTPTEINNKIKYFSSVEVPNITNYSLSPLVLDDSYKKLTAVNDKEYTTNLVSYDAEKNVIVVNKGNDTIDLTKDKPLLNELTAYNGNMGDIHVTIKDSRLYPLKTTESITIRPQTKFLRIDGLNVKNNTLSSFGYEFNYVIL